MGQHSDVVVCRSALSNSPIIDIDRFLVWCSVCPSYITVFLQAGDRVLYINGESTQGLTHAQVVERIRAGGPCLYLVLQRPQEMEASRSEEALKLAISRSQLRS